MTKSKIDSLKAKYGFEKVDDDAVAPITRIPSRNKVKLIFPHDDIDIVGKNIPNSGGLTDEEVSKKRTEFELPEGSEVEKMAKKIMKPLPLKEGYTKEELEEAKAARPFDEGDTTCEIEKVKGMEFDKDFILKIVYAVGAVIIIWKILDKVL